MSKQLPTPTSWTCAACGRRVPSDVSECRCGCIRPDTPSASSAADDVPAQDHRWVIAKLAASAVCTLAAISGAIWYSQQPQHRNLRRAASPMSMSAARPAVVVSTPPAVGLDAATSSPVSPPAPEPAITRATSPDFPESSAPPLEDTIERAMPAVVMIETQKSRGSGFFIKPDLIVTNAHVIAGDLFPTVTTRNGAKLNGKVAQVSDQFDIALIQVLSQGPADAQLPLGRSEGLRLGQGIVALGWAGSVTQSTVTRGIVTGLRRDGDRLLVQTDAVPNHGDSGGPVLDRRGQVIGVTTFRAENGSSGYAVAIDDVKPLVEKVTQNIMTVPLNSAVLAVPAVRQSDIELRRNAGLERYASTLASIAGRVADADASWSRYKTACRITAVPAGQTHEWFHLYDPQSALHRTTPRCAATLADIEREADTINVSMVAAEEAARQADVYPGTRRDMRQKYRLDYAGWQR